MSNISLEGLKSELESLPLKLTHSYAVDHYDKKGNEVLLHQPDCLRCR